MALIVKDNIKLHRIVSGMAVIGIASLKRQLVEGSRTTKERANAKLAILERDFFQCIRCGATEDLTIDHVKYDRYKLNVHKDEDDYKLDQCQTLCVRCHLEKNLKAAGYIRLMCEACGRRLRFTHIPEKALCDDCKRRK